MDQLRGQAPRGCGCAFSRSFAKATNPKKSTKQIHIPDVPQHGLTQADMDNPATQPNPTVKLFDLRRL